MLLYMIRHGQTDWNAEGRLQGQQDIPLNALGRSQATRNGERLREMIGAADGFRFIASPLSRTRETMERLRAAMGLDPLAYGTDERLVEVSFGDWEGHTLEEISHVSRERLVARAEQKWSFIPPGTSAESYEILCWRIGAWLQSLDGPTVCVSHGGVIRSLFRLIGNLDEDEAATVPTPQDLILEVDTRDNRIQWL
ncbi:histidine phosphatase family protein [Neorhizobium galegae]|uniref:Phosphoglycerate mutase n=1 Tax=Neorhizobium galegae bv. officinalis TaxID=323656 RepID=A0A0T7GCF0_NEOGA|nr:histidine phosphatase family protein [Neorhizobium galegae]CDZ44846.1 Phosphoglycerate mutase [Neorhizobium galegae bv. officinalis]